MFSVKDLGSMPTFQPTNGGSPAYRSWSVHQPPLSLMDPPSLGLRPTDLGSPGLIRSAVFEPQQVPLIHHHLVVDLSASLSARPGSSTSRGFSTDPFNFHTRSPHPLSFPQLGSSLRPLSGRVTDLSYGNHPHLTDWSNPVESNFGQSPGRFYGKSMDLLNRGIGENLSPSYSLLSTEDRFFISDPKAFFIHRMEQTGSGSLTRLPLLSSELSRLGGSLAPPAPRFSGQSISPMERVAVLGADGQPESYPLVEALSAAPGRQIAHISSARARVVNSIVHIYQHVQQGLVYIGLDSMEMTPQERAGVLAELQASQVRTAAAVSDGIKRFSSIEPICRGRQNLWGL